MRTFFAALALALGILAAPIAASTASACTMPIPGGVAPCPPPMVNGGGAGHTSGGGAAGQSDTVRGPALDLTLPEPPAAPEPEEDEAEEPTEPETPAE